jgi:hypothetical protein
MWTVRPKVMVSKQLTKATVVDRTLAMSLVMFMLISRSSSYNGPFRVKHRDEMQTIDGPVSVPILATFKTREGQFAMPEHSACFRPKADFGLAR